MINIKKNQGNQSILSNAIENRKNQVSYYYFFLSKPFSDFQHLYYYCFTNVLASCC